MSRALALVSPLLAEFTASIIVSEQAMLLNVPLNVKSNIYLFFYWLSISWTWASVGADMSELIANISRSGIAFIVSRGLI